MKVDWFFEIKESMTLPNLFARTLAKSLYTLPTRKIGQNFLKTWGLRTFGINVTK
jgi:hypothetical protein